jgi:F-type H+-transporting ATPase subunit epsilon
MADDTFHCSIVTPERAVLECDARSVVFPAWDGEIGILKNRAPLLCRLGIGVLRATTDEGETVLFVDGGFAQMVDNRLTVLTEQARSLSDLDRDEARRILDEAKGMRITDERSFVMRQAALRRGREQLRLTATMEE